MMPDWLIAVIVVLWIAVPAVALVLGFRRELRIDREEQAQQVNPRSGAGRGP